LYLLRRPEFLACIFQINFLYYKYVDKIWVLFFSN
jgi:hypothetical protein